VSDAASVVVDRLSALAAAHRAQGSRVGVGELLTAHRALTAIDPSSREDSRLALRAVLCSSRGDLERFDRAFAAVFGEARAPARQPSLEELGTIERAALPSAAIPGGAPPPPDPADEESVAVPAAWSNVELLRLRHKDFAQYSDAEMVAARLIASGVPAERVSVAARGERERPLATRLRRLGVHVLVVIERGIDVREVPRSLSVGRCLQFSDSLPWIRQPRNIAHVIRPKRVERGK